MYTRKTTICEGELCLLGAPEPRSLLADELVPADRRIHTELGHDTLGCHTSQLPLEVTCCVAYGPELLNPRTDSKEVHMSLWSRRRLVSGMPLRLMDMPGPVSHTSVASKGGSSIKVAACTGSYRLRRELTCASGPSCQWRAQKPGKMGTLKRMSRWSWNMDQAVSCKSRKTHVEY